MLKTAAAECNKPCNSLQPAILGGSSRNAKSPDTEMLWGDQTRRFGGDAGGR